MPRHRGTFKPNHPAPYELSRSRVENFIQCKACFWLDRAKGVKFPGIPSFLLNTNTDTLLKKDFDQYRGKDPHPAMLAAGLGHLRPFAHPDIDKWENSMQFGASPNHFNTIHEETNILFGGGLDDVWENISTGELHIVDYKSTAQMGDSPKPLDETFIAPPLNSANKDYKASFRRQMDMYQWVARKKGFQVNNTGYFVYVDGQHNGESGMIDTHDPTQAWMRFNLAIIPYVGNDSWVESVLVEVKKSLQLSRCPRHSDQCEFGALFEQTSAAYLSENDSQRSIQLKLEIGDE